MRVLLAYDGSEGSVLAADAVRSTAWPPDSRLRIISVIEPRILAASPWLGLYDVPPVGFDEAVETQLREGLERLSATLARPGLDVDVAVERGRPADAITGEAASFEADLIVLGSRGHGAVASLLLGSVSSEVVDRASAPVLVARRPTISRVVFGADGSPSSDAAEAMLRTWPIFDRAEIRAVSVASVPRPWGFGVDSTFYPGVVEAHEARLDEARATGERIARDAADRLRAAGRHADGVLRVGDPGVALVREAGAWGADVVVVGAGEESGLARILLGSVARHVLHASDVSVLIGRAPVAPARSGGGRRGRVTGAPIAARPAGSPVATVASARPAR